jgi:hypothetical protein
MPKPKKPHIAPSLQWAGKKEGASFTVPGSKAGRLRHPNQTIVLTRANPVCEPRRFSGNGSEGSRAGGGLLS